MNRRKTVMILQALLAVEALALAILVVLNHVTVGWIMALALFTGLVTAFEVPIRQAMVAELSGRESLMNAIALQSSVFNLARVLGPAFAGRDHRRVGRGGVLLPQRGELPRGDLGTVADGPGRTHRPEGPRGRDRRRSRRGRATCATNGGRARS